MLQMFHYFVICRAESISLKGRVRVRSRGQRHRKGCGQGGRRRGPSSYGVRTPGRPQNFNNSNPLLEPSLDMGSSSDYSD